MDSKFWKFLIVASVFIVLFGFEVYRQKSFKLAVKKHPFIILVAIVIGGVGWAYLRNK